MAKYKGVKSEFQLRSLVFDDYFKGKNISYEEEINKIDFIVTDKKSREEKNIGAKKHFVWMETKKKSTEMYLMLTQLLLTIKTTYDRNEYIIPNFIGCFDIEKIIFVPTNLILDLLHDNDIKWNIAPNNVKDEYFLRIINKLKYVLHNNSNVKIFSFGKNDLEVKEFIRKNIYSGIIENKFEITEHNFDRVYLKWVDKVKKTIAINWEEEKKNGILDGDFFLADLLSKDGLSLKEKLLIVLQEDHYKLTKVLKKSKFLDEDDKYFFKDKQKAYNEFWNIYKRPPLPKYWENIVNRKDLLVPQDIRERKGSFFTPQKWVELSQKYLSDTLGVDWQNKYYVWDCCAGTGNLLVGINRKIENVFASTIDDSDVKAIHDRIDNGARLLKKNVFQFDFLNDSFNKLPKKLKDIISNPKESKKLIIYINPPYGEASSKNINNENTKNKKGIATDKEIHKECKDCVGAAANQLFILFLYRIIKYFKHCKIGIFTSLSIIAGKNFTKFRELFKAKYLKGFIVKSNTFDNVFGNFPIGFHIWDLEFNIKFPSKLKFDVYEDNGKYLLNKTFSSNNNVIINWFRKYYDNENKEYIGSLRLVGTSFQHNENINVQEEPSENDVRKRMFMYITKNNIREVAIYFAIRNIFEHTWIKHDDHYLYPDEEYTKDEEFINNCFMYLLFDGKNTVKSKDGVNHWIPFTEKEVGAKGIFKSNFMTNFMAGKIKINRENGLFDEELQNIINIAGKLKFSKEAKEVLNAGKELWKYYHSYPRVNANASFYDIKSYFQEFKDGKMNNKSKDEEYNRIIGKLRDKMKILAKKIEPKVYEYGFLK